MIKKCSQKWALFLTVPMLVGLLLYLAFRHWAYDDPFITFRYADNLRSGLGFVYNPGEYVLSTTTPLYALLLAGLGHLWSDLPHMSNLISALSLALGGVFIYLIGQQWREPLAGLFAGILFPFFPLMISTFGAETGFYVMLILGAFALYAKGQHQGAMALTALATLTRAEGILVAAVLGVDLLVRQRRIPWQPLFLFALLVIPWYLFSWFYFGSPFPVTLAAKQHQGQMAISEGFALGFLRQLRGYAHQPLYWVHGTLGLLGVGYAISTARQWLPLLTWGALYLVSYTLLGVTRYFWYYAPLVPVILVLVGLGATAVSRWLLPRLTQKRRNVVLLICLLLLLWPQAEGLEYLHGHLDPRAHIYQEVGLWLAQNTPSEATVGTLEVGIIGYYANRHMIDFAGLIQPDVAQQMGRETTYQDTALWAVQRYQPSYLVLRLDQFPELTQGIVSELCIPLQTFVKEEYPGELVIYECHWIK
jgi:hypothetical protein